jgi:hypothetical protein
MAHDYDRRDWQQRQLDALKEKIAQRLRAACDGLPDEDFDLLVDQIARIQHKYEQQVSDEQRPTTIEPHDSDPSA